MINLKLDLPPKPKARPRVTRRGTFMPSDYQKWMKQAVFLLKTQWKESPLQKVKKITVNMFGARAQGDSDNFIGSVFDAMVKAGVIRDDSVSVVPHHEAKWERTKTLPSIEITIERETNEQL